MRVKLDENLPDTAADLIAAHHHDVHTIGDERLGGTTDAELLAAAGRAHRLLITLDRGFGDIRRYPPGTHGGILVLRLDHQSARAPWMRSSGTCSVPMTWQLWPGR